MRFTVSLRRMLVLPLLTATLSAVSQAQTVNINFDDLPATVDAVMPTGYAGLSWTLGNLSWGYVTAGQPGGYRDVVCRSGGNCAYNGFAQPIMISTLPGNAPITFSGWLRRWDINLGAGSASTVLLEALDATGGVIASQTITLTSNYQAFSFTALFSSLRFTPSGVACGATCGYFLLDDATVNPAVAPQPNVVPEPSTYLLMATGIIGLAALQRRRRAA